MKSIFALCAIFFTVILGGCAVSESSVDQVGDQVQDGLKGKGRLIQMNTTQDSYGPEYR